MALRVRDYTSADDDGCKDLERRASMTPPLVKLFFEFTFVHHDTFITKAKQYEEHVVLVGEDEATGVVCGAVCLGLKRVRVGGRVVKVGYLFDLRVHEGYQRRGLGRRLSDAVEARAWAAGAEMIHLTVNGNNAKAQSLWRALGYEVYSTRRPVMQLLHPFLDLTRWWRGRRGVRRGGAPIDTTTAVAFQPAAAGDGRAVLSAAIAKTPFGLADTEELLSSPFYLGAYIASDAATNSRGGVGVWDGAALTGIECYRFLGVPTWLLRYRTVRGLPVVAVLALLWYLWAGGVAWGTPARAAATAVVTTASWLAYRLAMYFAVRLEEPKMRCRLFAPFAEGPRGAPLCGAAAAAAVAAGEKQRYIFSVCNLDRDDHLIPHMPGAGFFTTYFMAKARAGGVLEGALPTGDAFFDPRDI